MTGFKGGSDGTAILQGQAMKISLVDPVSDIRWDEFVDGQQLGTIYHTSAWARVIQEAYGYLPRYLVLEDDGGRVKAALPSYLIKSPLTGSRLVCLPFSDYCFPLGEENDVKLLLDAIKKEVAIKAVSYLELRGWQTGLNPVKQDFLRRDYHLLYLIDLKKGIETVRENLHHSVKRGIHQAEQRGVTARLTREEADIEHFYRLNVATRKKLGVLPQPKAFFKALFRNVIARDMGFILLAEWEGKVVAGIVFLTYNGTIYYKFNASDENYLQKRPNHMAIWRALEYACDKGYKNFDFGRCSPEEEGLRTFKSRWGAREVSQPYYYYPRVKGFTTVPEDSLRYRSMRLFSHLMPTVIFRAAGSILYKHLA
jgi:lipid II:glycine glycyltransferase (peptidoglycan interpeptide bridge formation enzyme)